MERLDAVEDQSETRHALSGSDRPIDFIYIAASAGDARYTRICVASVRYFYPDIPVRLLVSGSLQHGLTEELRRYWNIGVAALPSKGDYGWGFVKLEPLFGSPGQRFLVLDSDTVLTGLVLDVFSNIQGPFLVDDEQQPDVDTKRLYYDWEKVRVIDPCAQAPRFVFNSGQWFGTAGLLTRDDFAPWIDWTLPRTHRHPECFMPGDQGVLNYVLNRKVAIQGLQVERQPIMRWPAHSMEGLDAERVSTKKALPRIVHWAGLKKTRHRDMLGYDLLRFFETLYYQRLPSGRARKLLATYRTLLWHYVVSARTKAKLTPRKLATRICHRAKEPPLGAVGKSNQLRRP
jgi:hypothetical protein